MRRALLVACATLRNSSELPWNSNLQIDCAVQCMHSPYRTSVRRTCATYARVRKQYEECLSPARPCRAPRASSLVSGPSHGADFRPNKAMCLTMGKWAAMPCCLLLPCPSLFFAVASLLLKLSTPHSLCLICSFLF
jgi:hypothetical protein